NIQTSPQTPDAYSRGKDPTDEHSPVPARNVLGVRDGIIRDQTALRTLQEYINTQCLK
ncbi:lysis protein, partial [Escherichia coli]|nr:lysis protein [Escherichia coli]